MRLGVIGINHKLADLKLRELLARACQRRFHPTVCAHGTHSFVLLSTCNRTEVYFSSQELPATHTYLLEVLRNDVQHDFEQKLYTFFGRDCFRHLARVVAGLDSAILCETEIQGQVRAAYETASEFQKLPEELHFLFQKVLKIGKQVRTELPLGRGMPDLEHAVLRTGTRFFACPEKARLLFVGASEINLKILCLLKRKGYEQLTICNRTRVKAEAIAERYGIDCVPWETLSEWPRFDWIVCGTKAPQPVILGPDLHALGGQKLLIDLSVPRNITPSLALHPQISLYNIDQINVSLRYRHRSMSESIDLAEKMVDACSTQQTLLFQSRATQREIRLAIGA
jgi:glutamyl-tRNA reductase